MEKDLAPKLNDIFLFIDRTLLNIGYTFSIYQLLYNVFYNLNVLLMFQKHRNKPNFFEPNMQFQVVAI